VWGNAVMAAVHATAVTISAVTISAMAMTGCGGPDDASSGAGSTVADSAGIRIVTSNGPRWTLETAWRLSDAPVLTIGVVDGPTEEQLFGVADAAVLSDGRIVVANSGTSELRIFDRAGTYVRSLGGEGEGPGEFRRITVMDVAAGDSMFVWDPRLRRLSVFSPENGFDRSLTFTPPSGGSFPAYEGRFSDGSLLVRVPTLVEDDELIDGAVRDAPAVYLRYGTDGSPVDTLGAFRGARRMIKFLGADARDGIAVITVPFDPATRVAIDGTSLYEGDGSSFELRRIGRTSAERAERVEQIDEIVRRVFTPPGLTPDLMTRDFEARFRRFAEQTDYYETIREAYGGMPVGETVAAFDRLRVSVDGELWVRAFPLPGEETHVWSVFSADGEWLGEVETPASLEVYEVGAGFLLGKQLDELEVEHVVLYEIMRP